MKKKFQELFNTHDAKQKDFYTSCTEFLALAFTSQSCWQSV